MPEPPRDVVTLGAELAWDLLDRMELCGEDISRFEAPASVSFHRLGKPPPQNFMPASVATTTELPLDANLIDLAEQLRNPGSDPPSDNIPFPDRLGQQVKFWETIHAPEHILTALKEGIDIGLIDDLESVLPKNGISRPNMKWESPAHIRTCQSLVKELTARGITHWKTIHPR